MPFWPLFSQRSFQTLLFSPSSSLLYVQCDVTRNPLKFRFFFSRMQRFSLCKYGIEFCSQNINSSMDELKLKQHTHTQMCVINLCMRWIFEMIKCRFFRILCRSFDIIADVIWFAENIANRLFLSILPLFRFIQSGFTSNKLPRVMRARSKREAERRKKRARERKRERA